MSASRFAAIKEVEAYWHGLRGDNDIPERSKIDPRGIQNALPYSFILECVAPRVARLRIAGSKVSDVLGLDVRGMPATCLIAPRRRALFGDILEDVFEMPAKATINMTWDKARSSTVQAQMILLPLQDHEGKTTRVLGCLQYDVLPRSGAQTLMPLGSVVKPIVHFGQFSSPNVQSQGLTVVAGNPAVSSIKQGRETETAAPRLTLVQND